MKMFENIKKIIITGDILRPSPNGTKSAQLTNISWLYNILKFPIESNLNNEIKVEMLRWEDDCFDAIKFYKLNNMNSSLQSWKNIYYAKEVSKESENYLLSFFENSFVIGFEMPEVFINIFEKYNVKYIDIIIHPIRYLDDLLFGFRTNSKLIFSKLKQYQVNPKEFIVSAGIHKATISRKPLLNLEKNSALFTGQVEIDKSLIKDEQCLSILDFKKEFTELTKQYKKVYFKKHPYAKENIDIDKFIKKFDNVEYIDENFYYLLGQDNIDSVYSISSSTVIEAKYWGKKSVFFYKNPFEFVKFSDTDYSSNKYIAIDQSFITVEFWKDIFNLKQQSIKDNYSIKQNLLRNSLNNYWGYDFFLQYNIMPNSINELLYSLKPSIQFISKELMNNTQKKVIKFYSFKNFLQKIKQIPLLGKSLLWFKHKILKWNK